MTLLLVLVLAAMWGAVLLPPYLKDRRDTVGGTSAVGEKLSALTARVGGGGSYLPVRSGSLTSRQTAASPLPAGARQPVAAGAQPEPRSSALHVLGPDGRPVPRPSSRTAPVAAEAARPATAGSTTSPTAGGGAAFARKRRRDVFFTLAAAAGLSLIMGWALGGVVWGLHLLADAALVAFAVLCVRRENVQAERDIKVAFLPHGQGRVGDRTAGRRRRVRSRTRPGPRGVGVDPPASASSAARRTDHDLTGGRFRPAAELSGTRGSRRLVPTSA